MIQLDILKNELCRTFCSAISVRAVPSGVAISTVFSDRSGDPIGAYLVETPEGYRIEDDGEYLSRLVGSGIPIDQGQRGQLLNAILAQGGAYWNQDTYEISSDPFLNEEEIGLRMANFISSLIRVRDLEFLTRELVRSTFREDATADLEERFGGSARFDENEAVDSSLSEFPADLVVRPNRVGSVGALYFVNTNEKLSEALLLQMEVERLQRTDVKIVALIEDSEMRAISKRKFQRAQNRSLSMPIYRGDEQAAITRIGRDLSLAA
jgi:Domain of unknown function DUF1828